MNNSVFLELRDYAIEQIKEIALYEVNFDLSELHQRLFNEAYYIVGYYQCGQWLKSHSIGELEAVGIVSDLQREHFGSSEIKSDDLNTEYLVNNLVFFWGYDVLSHMNVDSFDNIVELVESFDDEHEHEQLFSKSDFKELLLSKGLKVKDVSRLLNISASSIYKYGHENEYPDHFVNAVKAL